MGTPTPGAPRRHEYATSDPGEARELIDVLIAVAVAVGYERGHDRERYVPGDVFIANHPGTLTAFPNTLVPDPVPSDRTDARPGTLRRAIGFIDTHCDCDISLTDIARAVCVTPRAVQLAFRRHLDTTPIAHLRQVRLAEEHRQLRDATPGDGVTVTAVAARWGFTPSRFTERYRAVYGVPPSHTLRP